MLFPGTDILNLQLHLIVLEHIGFNSISDIKRAFALDITRRSTLTKGYAIDNIAGFRVNKLKFDMLLLTTDNLTRAIIVDTLCEKERFCAFRSKGSKAFQVVIKLLSNVLEIKKSLA